MKAVIYSTSAYERPFLEAANKNGTEVRYLEESLNRETASLAEGSEAAVIFTKDRASAEVLEALKKAGVQFLATRSMGVDHIDTDKARELGIKIANVPHYSPYSVAEHAVSLMLALNRKLVVANRKVREHDFRLNGLVGFDMHGKTVGIFGSGDIGSATAGILHGFGCKLLVYDVKQNKELIEKYGAQYVDLDELCKNSDIITIHAPLTEETRHIINHERIQQMKKGVMLINVARGALCRTNDVIEGIKSGQIGYLGMDVYEREEDLFFEDHSNDILQDDDFARLLAFKNVLLTGHQAFLTREALKENMQTTFQNLQAWAAGKKPENEL